MKRTLKTFLSSLLTRCWIGTRSRMGLSAALAFSLALTMLSTTMLRAASAPTGLSDEQIRQAYLNSYRYEKSQNYADSIKAISAVVTAYPQGYTVNLRLGWLYYLNGDYANSRQHYLVTIKVAPNSIEAKLGYTLPLMAQERHESTESVCRQILMVDSSNFLANLRLAYSLRMQKKFEVVEEVVVRMLGVYPTNVSLLTELGLTRVAQGRPVEAKSIFKDILILDPENVTAKVQMTVLEKPAKP